MAALGRIKCHLTVERLGEDLVEVALLTGGHGAVRQGNSDRRHVRADARRLDKGSPVVEESRPFSGVLDASDLPIETVYQRVGMISEQYDFAYHGGVKLLTI